MMTPVVGGHPQLTISRCCRPLHIQYPGPRDGVTSSIGATPSCNSIFLVANLFQFRVGAAENLTSMSRTTTRSWSSNRRTLISVLARTTFNGREDFLFMSSCHVPAMIFCKMEGVACADRGSRCSCTNIRSNKIPSVEFKCRLHRQHREQFIAQAFPRRKEEENCSSTIAVAEEGDVQNGQDATVQQRISAFGLPVHGRAYGRRQAAVLAILVWSSALVPWLLIPRKLLAEEESAVESQVESAEKTDEGVLGGLLSIFDPNETTKQGKKLPKAYLKSARDVVQTLRTSFTEESGSDAKFRRNADSAKEAIRQYISNWRGAKLVDAEQSYQALERALRVLGEFYSKKGPRAVLPEDVRARVLEDLQKADDAL